MKNYSKRLIDVIEYSREEAARLQNSYIGPEHLMLGIIREGEGEAMRVLRELHTDPMDIKRKIEQEIKNTFDSEDSVQHEIAISKTTERVLRMSMLESRLFKEDETDTEHLLLAILKEEFNVAAKVLNDAGITYRSAYNILVSGTGLNNMEEFDETATDIRMMTKMTRTKVSPLVVRHLAPLPVLEREPLNRNPLMIHLFWITSERI